MRSWLVLPAAGLVALGATLGLRGGAFDAVAAALAAAGMAAALRAIAGGAAGAITAAAIAPLLAIASILDRGGGIVVPCLALGALGWTLAELADRTARDVSARVPEGATARGASTPERGREVAPERGRVLVPALVGAVLCPALSGVLAIVALELVRRWWRTGQPARAVAVAAPIAAGLAIWLAVLAGTTHDGPLATLAERWFGGPPRPIEPAVLAARLGEALGPLASVAALAGLAMLLVRSSPTYVALAAAVAGVALVDLRAGAVQLATIGLAALCAGVAIERFAASIRLRAGQAFAALAVGVLLVAPPLWTAIESASCGNAQRCGESIARVSR